jgi:hypothetical protein
MLALDCRVGSNEAAEVVLEEGLRSTAVNPSESGDDGPEPLFQYLLFLLQTHDDRQEAIAVALSSMVALQKVTRPSIPPCSSHPLTAV